MCRRFKVRRVASRVDPAGAHALDLTASRLEEQLRPPGPTEQQAQQHATSSSSAEGITRTLPDQHHTYPQQQPQQLRQEFKRRPHHAATVLEHAAFVASGGSVTSTTGWHVLQDWRQLRAVEAAEAQQADNHVAPSSTPQPIFQAPTGRLAEAIAAPPGDNEQVERARRYACLLSLVLIRKGPSQPGP